MANNKVYGYLALILGCLITFGAVFNIIFIYRNSKSTFAIILSVFSLMFGIYDCVGIFWIRSSGYQILDFIFTYFQYILYLQLWVFAMKYIKSALLSFKEPPISQKTIRNFNYSVQLFYTAEMITLCLIQCFTYPTNYGD